MDYSIHVVPPSQDELYQLPYISRNNVEDEGNELDNDNVSNDGIEIVPAVEMSFDSADDVKTYRKYAIQKGFGIRTITSNKGARH